MLKQQVLVRFLFWFRCLVGTRMFPSARDLGGLSRVADSRFIAVVSVANCGASPVANLRAVNLCMTNRRVAFVNDFCCPV